MKIACGVIRDLLPLYAEKLTGEDSDLLIREHLRECKECSAYLEELMVPLEKRNTNISFSDNESSGSGSNLLMLVRKGILSRKITAVLLAVSLIFAVMLGVFSYIVKPEYISYADSGITVYESESGDVYARFSERVTSCRLRKTVDEDNNSVAEIEAWTSLWDRILGKTTPSLLISSKSNKTDIAYYDDLSSEYGNSAVIYGADTSENVAVLRRLILGYYFIAAFIAAVITGVFCVLFRKNKKASRICKLLFAAPISYMLAHLIIINVNVFASFSASNYVIINFIEAVAIYGVLIFGTEWIRQRRQDKIQNEKQKND